MDTRVLQAERDIRDWATLREQINNDLRNTKNLPQRHINQLLIIRNFATLRLKGLSCIKASVEIACQWHESEESILHTEFLPLHATTKSLSNSQKKTEEE